MDDAWDVVAFLPDFASRYRGALLAHHHLMGRSRLIAAARRHYYTLPD